MEEVGFFVFMFVFSFFMMSYKFSHFSGGKFPLEFSVTLQKDKYILNTSFFILPFCSSKLSSTPFNINAHMWSKISGGESHTLRRQTAVHFTQVTDVLASVLRGKLPQIGLYHFNHISPFCIAFNTNEISLLI